VLSHPGDPSGPWAWRGLAARGIPAQIVTAEELAFSTSLTHRLGRAGVFFDVTLNDGRVLAGDRLRGTLNRLVHVPDDHLARATPADRAYAQHELTALFTSVLAGLEGNVLNRATGRGLSGPWLSTAEWVAEAGRSGLTVDRHPVRADGAEVARPTHDQVVFVVGDRLVTSGARVGPPPEVAAGCHRLARRCGVGLLGIEMTSGSGGTWTFVGATPVPDLRPGGAPLLDALATALSA